MTETQQIPDLAPLRRVWPGAALPGFRAEAETDEFDLAELPPPPDDLDDEFSWLMKEPAIPIPSSEGFHPLTPRPIGLADVDAFRPVIADEPETLPKAFRRFVTSTDLQQRLRSPTDCYFEPGDLEIKTKDGGRLIHFLSDSQWCCHWQLYAHSAGEAVLFSYPAIGFSRQRVTEFWGDESVPTTFEAAVPELSVCADSFSEFIWRTWIENSIWWALHVDRRELTDAESAYVAHFKS